MASQTNSLNGRSKAARAGAPAPESSGEATRTCKVSVVVATIDRPALLREALASIRAVERDGVVIEILVGDTGTLPETRDVAEEFGAVYRKVDKAGCAAGRNAVMRLATGDYIAFLDDDDLWTQDHLHGHLALFAAQPELGAVIGRVLMTDPQRQPFYEPWPKDVPAGRRAILAPMLSGLFPQVGATVVRADVVRAVGEMDERLIGGTDWDWQLKIARRYEIGFVARTCVLFQQRPTGAYDELQLRRVRFTRQIFLRHALAEWRMWRSPVAFARAYFDTVAHYFYYFTATAAERAKLGDRRGALYAVVCAIGIFPTRAARMLVKPTPFRAALVTALTNRPYTSSD